MSLFVFLHVLCTFCLVLYLSGLFFAAVLHLCVFSVSSLFHSICHCGRCFESLQLFSQFFTFLFPFQCPYSHDLVFIVFFLLFFFSWKRVYVFIAVIHPRCMSKGPSASLWSLMTDFCSRSESRSPLPAPLFFKVSLLHWSLFDLWPLYENRWRRLTKQRVGTETGLQA